MTIPVSPMSRYIAIYRSSKNTASIASIDAIISYHIISSGFAIVLSGVESGLNSAHWFISVIGEEVSANIIGLGLDKNGNNYVLDAVSYGSIQVGVCAVM